MLRRLLNLLAVLSLLASVGLVLLWSRSSEWRDNLWRCGRDGGRLWWIESAAGRIAVRTAAGWPSATGLRRSVASASPGPLDLLVHSGKRPAVLIRSSSDPNVGVSQWESSRLGLVLRSGRVATSINGVEKSQVFWSLSRPMRYFELAMPYWLALLLVGLPLAAWSACQLGVLRRRRRASRGECPCCGYDLRATPGRCPECGTPAATPT